MKSAPFSRWRNSARFAANAELFFTPTRCNGLARNRLRTFSQFNADLVSVCAHKFHGPKGAGLLYIKSPLHPDPILFGGGHENERRAGTENLAGIIGLVAALERFVKPPVFDEIKLEAAGRQTDCRAFQKLTGAKSSVRRRTLPGKHGFLCRSRLGQHCVAGGTGFGRHLRFQRFRLFGGFPGTIACHCRPLGKPNPANSLVRFSLGRDSTAEEVDFVCARSAGGHPPCTTWLISLRIVCEWICEYCEEL